MAQLDHDAWFYVLLAVDFPTLENCSRTCRLFRKILEKNSVFWIQRTVKDKNEDILPPEKWRMAAIHNNFKKEKGWMLNFDDITTEKTEKFKFNYRKLVVSQKGFAPFKPYKIDPELPLNKHTCHLYNLGNSITIQQNGIGCNNDIPTLPYCFAFSYRSSGVANQIDLYKIGIDKWIMDNVRPTFRIRQQVNHHQPRSSQVAVAAHLSQFPRLATHHEVCLRLLFPNKGYHKTEHHTWNTPGAPQNWITFTICLKDYPSGMRYLQVYAVGKELLQERTGAGGHFGPKVGEFEIQIILPDEPMIMSKRKKFEPPSDNFSLGSDSE